LNRIFQELLKLAKQQKQLPASKLKPSLSLSKLLLKKLGYTLRKNRDKCEDKRTNRAVHYDICWQ